MLSFQAAPRVHYAAWDCADDGTWTHMAVKPTDFESASYTSFDTPAWLPPLIRRGGPPWLTCTYKMRFTIQIHPERADDGNRTRIARLEVWNTYRCITSAKRRGWDLNPCAPKDKRFSRPPRYVRFATSPKNWTGWQHHLRWELPTSTHICRLSEKTGIQLRAHWTPMGSAVYLSLIQRCT